MTNTNDSARIGAGKEWSIDEDGWIDGVVEYAGCGSHQAEWNDQARSLVLAAPDMLEALQAAYVALPFGSALEIVSNAIAKATGAAS